MPESRPPVSRRSFLRGSAAGALAAPAALAGMAAVPAVSGAAGAAARDTTTPLRLAKVWFVGDDALGMDTTHRIFDDGATEVLLWPGDLERLRAAGLRLEITDEQALPSRATLGAGVRPAALALQPGESATGDYRLLDEYEADLRALAAAHPTRARLLELPFVSFEGRTVLGLEIATDVHDDNDGRPTFHVDGLHHSREWPGGELSIMFAYDLLESYGTDPRVTALVDGVRTTIVPVVNPDGFAHSRTASFESPRGTGEAIVLGGRQAYWRKNRRSLTDGTVGEGLGLSEGFQNGAGTGADAYGVDPNRNYAFTWGRPGSSSADIHSQSHRGDEPFSEPETRNLQWLLTTRHITGAMTHHTYAGEIIWPWANEMGEAPDAALFASLAGAAGASNGYRARKYNTSEGTTPDHFYGATSTLSFLFEHGTQEFHPPYAADIPARYATNREAFLFFAEQTALSASHHGTITGRVVSREGDPLVAEVVTRRTHDNPLWLFGDGKAPRGRTSVGETFEARAVTDAAGRFTIRVNPSTQPHVVREGATQDWELTIHAAAGAAGGTGTARRVTIGRGEIVDLGTMRCG